MIAQTSLPLLKGPTPAPRAFPPTPAPPSRLCAAAAVIRGGRVLLVRRAAGALHAGAWTLPGGGVEPGDRSLVAAAARELREEVGLDLVGGIVADVVDGLSAALPFVTAVVVGTCAGGAEPRNLEPSAHDAVAWFSADEIPDGTWDRGLLRALLGPRDGLRGGAARCGSSTRGSVACEL